MTKFLTKDDVVGIFPPVATPFTDKEELDLPALRREIQFNLSHDITGVCLGGSTGEGHALTADELGQIIKVAVEEVKGRIPVMAGIITTSTREAAKKAKAAREAGARALMITPPIYQSWNEDGLVDFYSGIHRASELPIVTYNVLPHSPITPKMMYRLTADKSVGLIGTKESIGGSLETLTELLENIGDKISVTWAHDWLLYPGLAIGATGSISGMAAILPKQTVRMWKAIQANDLRTAQRLHFVMTPVAREISKHNWPAGTKLAINLQGRKVGPCRSPFGPDTVPAEQAERIKAALKAVEDFDARAAAA